jgi:hypothetical protein
MGVIRKEMTPWKSFLRLAATGISLFVGEKTGSLLVLSRLVVSVDISELLSKGKNGIKNPIYFLLNLYGAVQSTSKLNIKLP